MIYCPICYKKITKVHTFLSCSSCNSLIHQNSKNNCTGLTDTEFNANKIGNSSWQCELCYSKPLFSLPFADLDDHDWLAFNEDYTKTLSNDVHIPNSLEIKNYVTQCEFVNDVINSDTQNENLPIPVNSKYYDIKELNSLDVDSQSAFGLFHVNIASLNKHIDDLKYILSKVNFNFDVIGISEHKIRADAPSTKNIKIPGYRDFHFNPIVTTHGGTGFYVRDNLDFIERRDLEFCSPSHFESTFIEINFPHKKNLIIDCVYRHPTSPLSVTDFTNIHLQPILEKINLENKHFSLMGDFNIDLLKSESNHGAISFYNELSSNFLSPFILQPTRLKSKTVIDNILFNSLEYSSNSGNLLIEISDHLIQFLILEGFVKERSIPATRLLKRDFSHFNEKEFKEVVIIGQNWDLICEFE